MAQITKRNGKWQYRVFYQDIHGKRKSINKGGFSRKQEAEQAAREIETKKDQHITLDKERITLIDYYTEWIDTYKIGKYSKGTENRYLNVTKVIEKYFGKKLLKDITKCEYQQFMDDYSRLRSMETIQKTNSYIRAVVKDAIDEKIIFSDFTRNVQLHGVAGKDPELKFLNLKDSQNIIKLCEQEASLKSITKYEIYLGLMTGARFAEIAGLTWQDIDFQNQLININKTLNYKEKTGFNPTKTKSSERIVSIDLKTIQLLKRLKKEQEDFFKMRNYVDKLNLIFRNNRLETPSDTAVNKALFAIEDRLGIKNKITFHGLRHTHASILINNNVTITYVSKRLGHKNINVTTNIYSHLLKETYTEQSKITNKLLTELF